MMARVNLFIPENQVVEFCRRNYIRKLSLFGSALGDDFNDASDVDVLVEFEEGHAPGWEFVDMQDELSLLLGREVDLHTPQSLSKYFRSKVLRMAQVVYERAG